MRRCGTACGRAVHPGGACARARGVGAVTLSAAAQGEQETREVCVTATGTLACASVCTGHACASQWSQSRCACVLWRVSRSRTSTLSGRDVDRPRSRVWPRCHRASPKAAASCALSNTPVRAADSSSNRPRAHCCSSEGRDASSPRPAKWISVPRMFE